MTDSKAFDILLQSMSVVIRNLEQSGIITMDPEERITVLRRPTMTEFRAGACAAGLMEPATDAEVWNRLHLIPSPKTDKIGSLRRSCCTGDVSRHSAGEGAFSAVGNRHYDLK
jgi:hypothetical protein